MNPDYTPYVADPSVIPLRPKPPHPWFAQTPPCHVTTLENRRVRAGRGHYAWPRGLGKPYTVHVHQPPTMNIGTEKEPKMVYRALTKEEVQLCMRPWSVVAERKAKRAALDKATASPKEPRFPLQAGMDKARCQKRLVARLAASARRLHERGPDADQVRAWLQAAGSR